MPNSASARAIRESFGPGRRSVGTRIVMRIRPQPRRRAVVLRRRSPAGLIDESVRRRQREACCRRSWRGSTGRLSLGEARSRYDFSNVATSARRHGDHYVLRGTKAAVIGAPWRSIDRLGADLGRPARSRRVSLFVVDRHSANFICRASRPSKAGAPPNHLMDC